MRGGIFLIKADCSRTWPGSGVPWFWLPVPSFRLIRTGPGMFLAKLGPDRLGAARAVVIVGTVSGPIGR